MNILKFVIVALVVVYQLIWFFDKDETKVYEQLSKSSTVLAFGDSLTYGYGVNQKYSYPSVLARKISLHVENAGVSGEESTQGLKRLPIFLKQKPSLVILCHGGNDILRKRSKITLKNNLIKMIKMIEKSGAKVLLVGVPDFGFTGIRTLGLYAEVAQETGVMYEDNILEIIETDNSLKSDNIHPNREGYEMMADKFIEILNSYEILP